MNTSAQKTTWYIYIYIHYVEARAQFPVFDSNKCNLIKINMINQAEFKYLMKINKYKKYLTNTCIKKIL
jgi:hypothetical protein